MIILKILYILFQILWCLPQNLIGLILFCFCHLYREKSVIFRGAVVTSWLGNGCTSLGCFIFMDKNSFSRNRSLLVHEYGHTMQSLILGWLYLPLIVLPSAVWFWSPVLKKFRKENHYSYYRFYTERWANHLGRLICKEEPPM